MYEQSDESQEPRDAPAPVDVPELEPLDGPEPLDAPALPDSVEWMDAAIRADDAQARAQWQSGAVLGYGGVATPKRRGPAGPMIATAALTVGIICGCCGGCSMLIELLGGRNVLLILLELICGVIAALGLLVTPVLAVVAGDRGAQGGKTIVACVCAWSWVGVLILYGVMMSDNRGEFALGGALALLLGVPLIFVLSHAFASVFSN